MNAVPHLPLVVNIVVALGYALIGGLIARRLGLPTLAGYMLAGVAVGPVTPGFQADPDAINQLAEFGVILLMFSVGLHFSLRDLWQVRRIAVPGALVQMAVITVAGFAVGRLWGFSTGGAWVLGISISVASTVVLLRGFMDHGWLDSIHGKVAVGWLIFEDLLTVSILVLLPAIASAEGSSGLSSGLVAIGKAILFVALMLLVGNRVMPLLLGWVVRTHSRELFVLAALAVAAGTALASAEWFGVSLALGAFVAGVVVSESPFSHQVSADLLPFREAFAVIFFVSVGMLIDPVRIVSQWDQVLVITLIAVFGKAIVSALIAFALPVPARTGLIVGAGRSQIGEFSFIVGQAGVSMALLDQAQYALIVAAAIISITINPFMLRLVDPIERWLKRRPGLWRRLDRQNLDLPPPAEDLSGHVVIVGCGRVGRHIAEALGRLNVPRLVVEVNPTRLNKLRDLGVPVLYGDAGNSEIMDHAFLERARALVVTLPDDTDALAAVETARRRAPDLHIIARASTWEGARRLRARGVNHVVRPELEGGVEIVRRALLELALPLRDVQRYTDTVRREGLDESERPGAEGVRVLEELLKADADFDVAWVSLVAASPIAGLTIANSGLREKTGASVVAIERGERLLTNPGPQETLSVDDRVAVIGTPVAIAAAEVLIRPKE